jgi:hypothetical protein
MAAASHNSFAALPRVTLQKLSLIDRLLNKARNGIAFPGHSSTHGVLAEPAVGTNSPDTFSFASSITPMPVKAPVDCSQFLDATHDVSLPAARNALQATSTDLADAHLTSQQNSSNVAAYFGPDSMIAHPGLYAVSDVDGEASPLETAPKPYIPVQQRYMLQSAVETSRDFRDDGGMDYGNPSLCLMAGEYLSGKNSPSQAAAKPELIETQNYIIQQQLHQQISQSIDTNLQHQLHQQQQQRILQNHVHIRDKQHSFADDTTVCAQAGHMWEHATGIMFDELDYPAGEILGPQILSRAFQSTITKERNAGQTKLFKRINKTRKNLAVSKAASSIAAATIKKSSPKVTIALVRKSRTYARPTPSQHCHVCSRRPTEASPHSVCGNLTRGKCRKTVCEKCLIQYGLPLDAARNAQETGWVCPHCNGKCPERAQCHIYDRTSERRRNKTVNHRKPKSAGDSSLQGSRLKAAGKLDKSSKKRNLSSGSKKLINLETDMLMAAVAAGGKQSPGCGATMIDGPTALSFVAPLWSLKVQKTNDYNDAIKNRQPTCRFNGQSAHIMIPGEESIAELHHNPTPDDFFEDLLATDAGRADGSDREPGDLASNPSGIDCDGDTADVTKPPSANDLLTDFMTSIVESNNEAQECGSHEYAFVDQSQEIIDMGFMTSFGDGDEIGLIPGSQYLTAEME